jgi:hypothetical protein
MTTEQRSAKAAGERLAVFRTIANGYRAATGPSSGAWTL